jgi:hypothetical protein
MKQRDVGGKPDISSPLKIKKMHFKTKGNI